MRTAWIKQDKAKIESLTAEQLSYSQEKRIYVTAPSAKVRPPDPRPRYGFPPANAGALGAAEACSLL